VNTMKYAFALSPVLLLVAACDRQPSGEIAAPAPNQAQSATIEPTAPPPSAVPTEPVTKDSNVPAPASPAEGPSRDLALSVETQGMETRVAKIYQESVDAAKFDPESADAWGRLGMVLHVHDFFTPAIAAYAEAARLNPGDFRWRYFRAFLEDVTGGDPAVTLAEFEAALSIRPKYVTLLLRYGDALIRAQRLEDAEKAYLRATTIDPNYGAAMRKLGEARMALGQTDAAIRTLERSAALDPRVGATWALLAQLHHRAGNADLAGQAMTRSEQLGTEIPPLEDPIMLEVAYFGSSGILCRRRAEELVRNKMWDEALNNVKVAIEVQPNDAEAYVIRGRAHYGLGQAEQADIAFRKAIEIDGMRLDARLGLANLALARNDVAGAEMFLEQMLALNPQAQSALIRLATIRGGQGRREEALELFTRAGAAGELDAAGHVNWAALLLEMQNPREALPHLVKAVNMRPDYAQAHYLLAVTLESDGQKENALKHYARAAELDPTNERARERVVALSAVVPPSP